MRSRYTELFNHDEDAVDYDADVADETGPLREAYGAVLDWSELSFGIRAENPP